MLSHGKSSDDSAKAQLKAKNPIVFLTIALFLTGAVVIALGCYSYNSYRNEGVKEKRNSRIYELRSSILHSSEVLTMLARLAVATGDIQWEERYLEYEPKLDAVIKEAIAIAPETYDSKMATIFDMANIKLVEMEKQAFDLVRQGNVDEAKALLSSDEYENQKWMYTQGISRFARDMAVHSQFHKLRASIIYLNDVLDMSVQMAAATGDLQWEKRYRRYTPELDVTIKEAIKQAPKAFQSESYAMTDVARVKLVEMDNRAFDLIREGYVDEAKALVFGDEYKKQRQIYADGMDKINFELNEAAVASLSLKQNNTYLHIAAVAFLIPLLLISWIVVIRVVRRWETVLTENNKRLARQADEVTVMNKYLDQKVEERTGELNKRIKEMNCLYGVSRILASADYSFHEKMKEIVETIPSGWKHTSITCAAITIDGKQYHTGNFKDSQWKLTRDITVDGEPIGKIEVCYLEDKNEMDEGSFLMEERNMINIIGEQIGIFLESERIEVTLVENRRFVQSIIDSLRSAVFVLDSETLKITDCNAAAVEIFEFSKEELTGKSFDFLFPKSNGFEDYKKKLFKAISKKGVMHAYDVKMKRKGGEIFFAEHNTIPLQDKSGSRIGWVSTIQDITERRILETEFSQGQKLQSIGQLAAGIAHEINTPTQFVSDNTRFLQDSFKDLSRLIEKYRQLEKALTEGSDTNDLLPEITDLADEIDVEFLSEDIPKAIEQSLDGLGRVSDIVRAMKDFAHPDVNEKKSENLNRIIESTATVARNEWKYVSEMKLELDPDLPLVVCKGSEIGQVLLNIIINAAQAIEDAIGDETGKLGEIKITTHRDDEWVEIRISDTGTGIPEESRSHVFDHFYTTKEVGKGTGQGLAISHSAITKNHQGSLTFETEMGKGTTFIIRLPFIEDLDNTESAPNEEATALC